MAYLGKSPSQGVRNRYYFTASGGETSISGALTGGTLTFTDGNYVDVNLNGVTLVAGTDYNTSTANTIAGLSALTASDVVEIVVYDVFSVFSGNVNSDFSVGGNLSVTGTTAFTGATTITGLTTTGDIELAKDAPQIDFNDTAGGTQVDYRLKVDAGEFSITDVTNSYEQVEIAGGIVKLRHNGSTKVSTTSTGVDVTGTVTMDGGSTSADFSFGDQDKAIFGAGSDLQIWHDTNHSYIQDTSSGDLRLTSNGSGVMITKTTTENMARFLTDGAVELYYDGGTYTTPKLATTATGVDVTGTAVVDALTCSGSATIEGTSTFGTSSADTRFNFDGPNQYRAVFKHSGNIAGQIGGGGADELRFSNAAGAIVASITGGGITFNGDTAAANALDDYEEGTWTPTASGGYTISSSSGAYTKIGRVVHLWGTVQFSAVGGNTSTVVLGSAPFTNSTHLGTGVCRENTSTGTIYVFRIAPNSTSMEINSMDGITSGSNRTIRTGENYAFHGSYYVA